MSPVASRGSRHHRPSPQIDGHALDGAPLDPPRPEAGAFACGTLAERPEARDIIQRLVAATGGVTELEASVLLLVLDRLEEIAARWGPEAASSAAHVVSRLWLEKTMGERTPRSADIQ